MYDFGRLLKQLRIERGLSQEKLAELLGTSKQVISRYESGQRTPKITVVQVFADKLGVPIAALTGADQDADYSRYPDLIPISQMKMRRVPVVGEIAAGVPITADQQYDEYIDIPDTADARKYDLSLRVKGDSMKPRYLDGDLVFIRRQPDVRDGQIAAVVVGDEATLKRVYHVTNGVQLISENPEYGPMLYTEDDVNDIHLIGLAVGFMRWEKQR